MAPQRARRLAGARRSHELAGTCGADEIAIAVLGGGIEARLDGYAMLAEAAGLRSASPRTAAVG